MIAEKESWKAAWFKPPETEAVLAVGSLALFAFISVQVVMVTVPEKNEKYAMLMLGALIGIVKDTFGRYFQATKGAQEQRRDAAVVAARTADAAAALADKVGSPTTLQVDAEEVTVTKK